MTVRERILQAQQYLEQRTDFRPELAIVLGSGLGGYAQSAREIVLEVRYDEIPGFPVSTAPGHAGKLVFCVLGGKRTVLFCGRFHCYEGYSAAETVIPLHTAMLLGVNTVILTNAAGGVNTAFRAGAFMLIADQINLSTMNALQGENLEFFGPRFSDQTHVYDVHLRALMREAAQEVGVALHEGVYAFMCGPTYETPAEVRALRTLGADAVGMSTVHEASACAHAGVQVCALSCITNMAAGVLEKSLDMQEVLQAGDAAAQELCALLDVFVNKLT